MVLTCAAQPVIAASAAPSRPATARPLASPRYPVDLSVMRAPSGGDFRHALDGGHARRRSGQGLVVTKPRRWAEQAVGATSRVRPIRRVALIRAPGPEFGHLTSLAGFSTS